MTAYVNYCRGCGRAFSAVAYFDRHRVGDHEVDEGPNRRRCMDEVELAAARLVRDDASGRYRLASKGAR